MKLKYYRNIVFIVVVVCQIAYSSSNDEEIDSQEESGESPQGRGFLANRLKQHIEDFKQHRAESHPSIFRPIKKRPSSSSSSDKYTTLDKLYKAALEEAKTNNDSSPLIIYAGGQTANEQDIFKTEFEKKFPNLTIEIIIDSNKIHEARIDTQLATGSLVPDLFQLQPVRDLAHWKSSKVLLSYKPIGWKFIYPKLKLDSDGLTSPVYVDTIGLVVNKKVLGDRAKKLKSVKDLLKPEFAGKLIGPYPGEDDAVLFWYRILVDKYGWEFIDSLVEQNITFVRGTTAASKAVAEDGSSHPIGLATYGPVNPKSDVHLILEGKDNPFVSWVQYVGIFKNSSRPFASKLYASWLLDNVTQSTLIWNVRSDLKPVVYSPNNHTIWEYSSNSNPLEFGRFLNDRAELEKFRTQINTYFRVGQGGGEGGESPTGVLGMHPTKELGEGKEGHEEGTKPAAEPEKEEAAPSDKSD